MTIPPNIGWEDVSIKATGASQTRTFADRFGGHVVNVKEWGAEGDGTTDDTDAIQACIDAAFAGGLANPEQYKILYFPTGRYLITSPLYISNVNGGLIFGDGMQSVTFLWGMGTAAFYPGNTVTGDGTTPMFVCENVSNTRFEGFGLIGDKSTNDPDRATGIGIYFFCSDGGVCERNILWNIVVGDFGVGVQLGGAGSDQHVRDHLMISVQVSGCCLSGTRTDSAASIGHVCIGGGNIGCGFLILADGNYGDTLSTYVPGTSLGSAAGGYSAVNGQLSLLAALSVGYSTVTAYNASRYPMCVMGAREEANVYWQTGFVSTNSPAAGGPAGPMLVCNYVNSGLTTVWHPGDAGEAGIPVGRPRTNALDVFDGGRIHSIGQNCGSHTNANSEVGNFALVDSTSSVIIDEGDTTYDAYYSTPLGKMVGLLEGTGTVYLNALRLKDNYYTNDPDGWWPLYGFAGKIVQTTNSPSLYAAAGNRRGLPPAGSVYAGARFTLTDSPTAMTAGNFWASVTTGSGANVTSVFCDGTTWRVA